MIQVNTNRHIGHPGVQNSSLYYGTVFHNRGVPVKHQFNYRLFMVYLDLADLDTVFKGNLIWSTHRPAPARFRREDHLGDPMIPLDRAVRDLIRNETGKIHQGPIYLLTHLRYWGYVMNPVSFYYCLSEDNASLDFVVLEVHNTPWGEMHPYVLENVGENRGVLETEFSKIFHVSPFMGMDMKYRLKINCPNDHIKVELADYSGASCVFTAVLTLMRKPITHRNLYYAFLRHPFMTGKIIAAIYFEAFRLWRKGAPYFPYTKRSENRGEEV
jgi:uncharacterized protein